MSRIRELCRASRVAFLTSPLTNALPCRSHRNFAASDLRILRASVNAFMDMTALCTRTLETFGDSSLAA